MAWERRARGGAYYTRSRKQDGRVVREYCGSGRLGEALAAIDASGRVKRQAERARDAAERNRLVETDVALDALCEATRTITDLCLIGAGYRQHDRGEWRKQRGTHQSAGAVG
jgi:hypothetical protein